MKGIFGSEQDGSSSSVRESSNVLILRWNQLDTKTMANILILGCGGVGTIAALNLQPGGKARATTVMRSNYDHVNEHGFQIRSVDHGIVESFPP